jgi:hypothetical protein
MKRCTPSIDNDEIVPKFTKHIKIAHEQCTHEHHCTNIYCKCLSANALETKNANEATVSVNLPTTAVQQSA